ncbi:WAT1-related protein At5g40230-like isoform X2 [Cynara cardunculus var. scolymus]|uniref:WAT1-related protein At5g40230-like isoform X2 n=1 Tax=Cynara cardunculus var. scolymus TaxID=59895 RepID=UPI000D625F5A|nr:WAT1-related protein At5g40230-like isoform X2 [Cynara cardunculus var. scolymus]
MIGESSSTDFHRSLWTFHYWPTRVFGYSGISYSSATLATTILNLIPGFTFILAILCRMEAVNFGSSTTQAKFIGTVVSIAGAILVTLYKGPSIIPSTLKSEIPKHLLVQPSNWVIGGVFLGIDCVFSSMFIISQAFVLKKYPAVMIVMFSYCFVCTILSVLTSLIVGADLSTFSLRPKKRLLSILYSGIFGSAFQVTIQAWCVQRKGPLFVSMFHPVGIVISTLIGLIFLGDGFYLGSLVGSVVVVFGFYTVMWGKAKEQIVVVNTGGSSKLQNEGAPLLRDNVEEQITSLSP